MTKLEAKGIVLEAGRPKVVVPVTAASPADIIAACEAIREMPCHMVEWRVDYYLASIQGLEDWLKKKDAYVDMIKILDDMEYITGVKPIIFTIRSSSQGGKVQVARDQLEGIYSLAVRSGLAAFVDIEMYDRNGCLHEEWIRGLIETVHGYGGRAILSHHDFHRMPEPGKIAETVQHMHRLGADLCKFAAMAHSKADAETLLKTSAYLHKQDIGPLVMLAMGEHGQTTRVAGGRYGSVLTFASGAAASAPGQPDVYTMKKWLDGYYGLS